MTSRVENRHLRNRVS